MAEVKWIKITVDMFDNRKIKHLRKLPDGNNIVLIWVMLLTMAGRCNASGMIFLTENIPYTPKMLADELDFEESTVRLALRALEDLGMVVTSSDGVLAVPGWGEYQNIEGMELIREQNRIRKQRYDAKQKLLSNGNVTGNVTVTESNAADIDKDKESDIDKDKEKETIYKAVVDYLNERAGTKYRANTGKTKSCINARVSEGFTLEDFRTVIEKKCQEWIGTEYEKYLRPETLFGTKFEGYLNARKGGNRNGNGTHGGDHESDGNAGIWF